MIGSQFCCRDRSYCRVGRAWARRPATHTNDNYLFHHHIAKYQSRALRPPSFQLEPQSGSRLGTNWKITSKFENVHKVKVQTRLTWTFHQCACQDLSISRYPCTRPIQSNQQTRGKGSPPWLWTSIGRTDESCSPQQPSPSDGWKRRPVWYLNK